MHAAPPDRGVPVLALRRENVILVQVTEYEPSGFFEKYPVTFADVRG